MVGRSRTLARRLSMAAGEGVSRPAERHPDKPARPLTPPDTPEREKPMPRIGNLDEFLLTVVDGLPSGPYDYEFRCHPDVYQAIREATPAAEWTVPGGPVASRVGKYGPAAITVDRSIGPGAWELLERGEVLNSGRLQEEVEP